MLNPCECMCERMREQLGSHCLCGLRVPSVSAAAKPLRLVPLPPPPLPSTPCASRARDAVLSLRAAGAQRSPGSHRGQRSNVGQGLTQSLPSGAQRPIRANGGLRDPRGPCHFPPAPKARPPEGRVRAEQQRLWGCEPEASVSAVVQGDVSRLRAGRSREPSVVGPAPALLRGQVFTFRHAGGRCQFTLSSLLACPSCGCQCAACPPGRKCVLQNPEGGIFL